MRLILEDELFILYFSPSYFNLKLIFRIKKPVCLLFLSYTYLRCESNQLEKKYVNEE
jgi:hypothetical protein